ncbi:translation initiation factor SUI1 [Pavlovales sp. CCMP2436]|nr:translation initiation factor SUI1 [Pavlovales sp. CCMP2436]
MNLESLANPGGFDPFDTAGGGEDGAQEADIHIRVQQRNGRKCITTVQGLDAALDLKKVLKVIKKEYCCNGNIQEDEVMGQILQFQGDQRQNVGKFLIDNQLAPKDKIKTHGF